MADIPHATILIYLLDLNRAVTRNGEMIMSRISDFAATTNAFMNTLGTAIENIAQDIAALKATIETLQNSPGAMTPEDQALLDQAQAQLEAMATRAQEIDAMTPPVAVEEPPVEEPVEEEAA